MDIIEELAATLAKMKEESQDLREYVVVEIDHLFDDLRDDYRSIFRVCIKVGTYHEMMSYINDHTTDEMFEKISLNLTGLDEMFSKSYSNFYKITGFQDTCDSFLVSSWPA